MRTKLKNLKTGGVIDRTFNAGEKFEQAVLDRYPMQYLYKQDDDYVLMHPETFEQVQVNRSTFGDSIKYLKDGMEVNVIEHDGKILGAEVPFFVRIGSNLYRPQLQRRHLVRRRQTGNFGRRRRRDRPVLCKRGRQSKGGHANGQLPGAR